MKLQFDLPNVCQKEKISPQAKKNHHLANKSLAAGLSGHKKPC
jgi:hypothetical protein